MKIIKDAKKKKALPALKVPLPEEIDKGATGEVGLLVGDVEVAYALVRSKNHPSLFHLLKMKIEGDVVVRVEKDVEDLRGIKLARLHDDAMSEV